MVTFPELTGLSPTLCGRPRQKKPFLTRVFLLQRAEGRAETGSAAPGAGPGLPRNEAASSRPELLQDKDPPPGRGRTGGWLAAHFQHELKVQAMAPGPATATVLYFCLSPC